MAALAAKKDVRRQENRVMHFQVAAATKIYEGSLVSVNSAGYAIPSGDNSGDVFVGVASKGVDNTSGAAGAVEVEVYTYGVIDVVSNFSAAQTNVTDLAYVVDSQTVDLAAVTTNDVKVGRIVEVISTSKLRVAISTLG